MCFTQACCDHREVMQCMTCLVIRLCPLPIAFRCYSPCIRAMLSRLIDSVYFLLSSTFAVHAPSNATRVNVFCCSPCTEQRYRDSVYSVAVHAQSSVIKIQSILLTLHAPSNDIEIQCILLQSMHPSNAIEIESILLQSMYRATLSRFSLFCCSPCTEQRYQDSVYSVAVHAPSNAIKIQSILLQSMHRATLSRFSLFCCSPCTEQRYQDSVYSVAVHAPSNAIKIQSILLQSMHRATLSRFSPLSVVFRFCRINTQVN